jgi:hypothetical protein
LNQGVQVASGQVFFADLDLVRAGAEVASDGVQQRLAGGEGETVGDVVADHFRQVGDLPHGAIINYSPMDERAFYKESPTTKPVTLNCPYCRTQDTYDLRWLVRKKVDRLPGGADERDRAKFAKAASYMVLMDDKAACKNMRCRKTFDISGVKTTAFI